MGGGCGELQVFMLEPSLILRCLYFCGLCYLWIFYIFSLVAYPAIHPTDLANTTLHSRILEYRMQVTEMYYFHQATHLLKNKSQTLSTKSVSRLLPPVITIRHISRSFTPVSSYKLFSILIIQVGI